MGSLKSEEELEQIEEEASKEAILYVNGSRKVLPDGLAHATLLEYLRGTRSRRRGILRVREWSLLWSCDYVVCRGGGCACLAGGVLRNWSTFSSSVSCSD